MMSVEVSEKPTAAELELEAGMRGLREAISNVPEAEHETLAPIQAALSDVERSLEKEDHSAFVCALVALARAVIKVRQVTHSGPLAKLPVPPYDLWLPFKAGELRPSD